MDRWTMMDGWIAKRMDSDDVGDGQVGGAQQAPATRDPRIQENMCK